MLPNTATTPNQGGEPIPQSSSKPTIEVPPRRTKPSCWQVALPHKNDKHRALKWCSLVTIILLWLLLALQIAATQQSLMYAPYGPIGLAMVIACVLFWVFAIAEISIFSVLTKRTMDEHVEDGHGYDKRHWCRRYVLSRWTCVALIIALMGSMVMLWLMLVFFFPEFFHRTDGNMIVRLASVNDTTASFFIRYKTYDTPLYIEYRQGNEGPFQTSEQVSNLPGETDYTTFIAISGLSAASQYEWRFNREGVVRPFNTAPAVGTPSTFKFVFGSCFMYNFPFELKASGFEHIEQINPDFMTFIGDFIYADVPLYHGGDVDDFEAMYRQNFRNGGLARALAKIPTYFMWDDHEIYNDWDISDVDLDTFHNAINVAWMNYVGKGNPRPFVGQDIYYYSFDRGDTSYFVMDTRSFRSDPDMEDGPSKTFLGTQQKQRLLDWLVEKRDSAVFKFLLSPVGWSADLRFASDAWGGYNTERLEILNFIRDNNIGGCIFLSGDSHFAYAVELLEPGSGLFEFSASPVDGFDFDLGGYSPYSSDPWRDEAERTENILWYDMGPRGSLSFIGVIDVNTQAETPSLRVSILNREKEIFSKTLTVDDVNPSARRLAAP